MKYRPKEILFFIVGLFVVTAHAQSADPDLDTIGVTLLRAVYPGLNGTGVRIAQPEAADGTAFEVNPMFILRPTNDFTYYTSSGSADGFPNNVGTELFHAAQVGQRFYGLASFPGGVATNVSHIDNYDANYFALTVVPAATAINATVVNQSFIFGATTVSEQQTVDANYDKYAVQYNTLFVSGAGNGGPVAPPATSYDGIGVGAYGGATSVGPTPDNGRAKPDITAPGSVTSFSTPRVSGAAAILKQAGLRGDGGADTNSAANIRTIKALLLNGAVKPNDWTHASPSPLDTRYGAGVVNVFNAYTQLAGGKHGYIDTSSVTSGNPHPPTGATGNVSTLNGWDFNTAASTLLNDGVNHYYFNLPGSAGKPVFTGVITLAWNRNPTGGQTGINKIYLYLYAVGSGTLLGSSVSTVDNVQHIFVNNLPPGRYDVQVLKVGGVTINNTETYALAYTFFATPLRISSSGGNVTLAWPFYPAGYVLQFTPNLTAPMTWSNVVTTPTMVNGTNRVVLTPSGSQLFYRLGGP